MTTRLRLLIAIARPSVVAIFALFTAVGVAEGGAPQDAARLLAALVPVIGFVLFSIVVNDLADRAIDEVNLAGDRTRPLVASPGTDRQFVALGLVGAVVAIVSTVWLHGPATAIVATGLLLSAAYSVRPVRIAERGVIASMLLPAGYVAVPYLLGICSVRGNLTRADVVLGAGLYVGFIGRILLKDFRDVRGDALFGKRTFLVRHGRRGTCAFSAACWIAGIVAVLSVRGVTLTLVATYTAEVVIALLLLARLSASESARRDEHLISAIAIVGRGLILTVLAHLSTVAAGWSSTPRAILLISLAALVAVQAHDMARFGPVAGRQPEPVDDMSVMPDASDVRVPVR